jgi:pimeloyl-ACP methyl ester carboxylesterase
MNLLAADLARMGVRAFIPELPVLKQALVREETLPRIRRTFVQVASRPDVRADRIIMAGFSFAGGLVLKASTEPEVTPTAVLSYGSYFDLESSLRYFLSGYARFPGVTIRIRPHEYARAVFFWNFLDQMAVDLDTGSLRQCMNWFINDQQDRARSFARGLGAAEQRFAQSAFDPEDPEGIRMAEKIMPRIRGQLRSLSPKYFLDRITVPVFLVHGVNDTMVPYTETLAMAHALAQAGKPHDVYISGIYSHSEAEKRRAVALFREIRDLIRSLNKMLTYLF